MKNLIAILLISFPMLAFSQVYESTDGRVSFFSDAPLQDIEASNHQVVSYYDTSTSYILFDVLIDAFEFDQGLMRQHFNDRFLESEIFPKAEFFGKVIGFDPHREGIQNVSAIGEITIHGVTNEIKYSGRMSVSEDGSINLISRFTLNIEDFAVDAPMLFFHPVAEAVDVRVDVKYHLTGS
jgi:hypothetical protein